MKKNSPIKKHHFWILFGVVPLLVFLAIILLMSIVGDAIADQEKKIKDSQTKLQSTQPKGKGLTEKIGEQQKELLTTRGQLWKANYERQVVDKVFNWPLASNLTELKNFEKKYTKFGEPMQTSSEDEAYKFARSENYLASYQKLADTVAPTRFANQNWRSVLRHVSDWEKSPRPDSTFMWLAIEDFWIQKALLDPVKTINDSVSKFHLQTIDSKNQRVNYDASKKLPEPPPLERVFVNRTWELSLSVITENGKRLMKSKLKNRTDRLQSLGLGKTMKLLIWLDDPKVTEPIDYKIEGELVKGNAELDVKLIPAQHAIPPGTAPIKITKVEQVLDDLTVPVRMIKDIQIGVLDHKRQTATLVAPDFIPAEAAPATGSEGYPMGGPGGPMGMGLPMPPGRMGEDGIGMGGNGIAGAKYGTPQQVLLGNKLRYIESEKTKQVRRVPVGVVLVLDLAYIDDAFAAFANSPLRFQLTQPQVVRFRDPLPPLQTQPGTGGLGEGDPFGGPGGMPPGGMPPGGMLPGGMIPGPGGAGTGSGNSTTSVQSTAGLVELGLFGIISLYEKYVPEEGEKTDTKETTTPMPKTPMTPAPMPMTPAPMPMTPMTPAPMPKIGEPKKTP